MGSRPAPGIRQRTSRCCPGQKGRPVPERRGTMRVQTVLFLMVLATVTAARPAVAAPERVIRLPFTGGDDWRSFADEPWWAVVDLREMLSLFHPFSLSRTGAAAGASREVTLRLIGARPTPSASTAPTTTSPTPRSTGRASSAPRASSPTASSKCWSVRAWSGSATWWTRTPMARLPFCRRPDAARHARQAVPAHPPRVRQGQHRGAPPQDVWFIGGTWYAAGDGKTEQPPASTPRSGLPTRWWASRTQWRRRPWESARMRPWWRRAIGPAGRCRLPASACRCRPRWSWWRQRRSLPRAFR